MTKRSTACAPCAVLDQDIDGGQVAEQALDFFAEDKRGNVWYLGSYTEAYEGGQFVNAADAWLAGVDGAEAGILMQAKPRTGTPPYVQAQVPGDDPDVAQVLEDRSANCVPFKCYTERARHPGGRTGGESKYFAPGVGGIRTEPLSGRRAGDRGADQLHPAQPAGARGAQRRGAEARQARARRGGRTSSASSQPAKRAPART